MGRHRNRRGSRTARQLGVAVAVLALSAAGLVGYRVLSGPHCTATVRLSVAAVDEIAPAVRSAVDVWTDAGAVLVDGRCVAVTVTSSDSADVASAIAAQRDQTLAGLGRPSGSTVVPDVWIPDSSLWLRRLRALAEEVVPADPPSIARSPIVLAAPEPVASSLGWPEAKLTWSDVLSKVRANTTLHVGIVDPTRDAAGLASLVTLTGAGGSGETSGGSAISGEDAGGTSADQRATVVAALRALADGRSLVRDDLMRRFPRGTDPASLASGLSLAPLPEHAILSYDEAKPPVRVVGIPVSPNPPGLDYPLTVLPATREAKGEAAAALRVVLSGYDFRDQLSEVGLRASDGTVGASFSNQPVVAVDPGMQAAVPDGATADQALATWSAITASARMLAVLDVSGSMLEPVPTAGGVTRMALTVEAAKRGLALFDDSWAVGLWTFSTHLDGDQDYLELAPIGPLTTQRGSLNQLLAGVTPKRTGDTGLYDTLLAAYKTAQEGWDPGRVNSVVLLTDGQNDDDNGISLDKLLEELQKAVDPDKPIQMILIGIGTGTSESTMSRITDVTGGGAFVAEDPAKIGEIFLQAIALRSSTVGG